MAGMAEISQVALLGLDRAETTTLIEDLGEPAYRAKQLLDAVYRQRVESIGMISTWSQRAAEQAGGQRHLAGTAPDREQICIARRNRAVSHSAYRRADRGDRVDAGRG